MFGRVSRQFGLLALGLGFGAALAGPARAQPFGWFGVQTFHEAPRPAPSPRAIHRSLERQGYRILGPLRLNGDVVLADAVDSGDRRVRLVVDPIDGRILQRFASVEPRPQRPMGRPDETPVIRAPNFGYLDNGASAPPPDNLAPAEPRARPRAKPLPRAASRAEPKPAPAIQPPAIAEPPATAKLAPAAPPATAPPAAVEPKAPVATAQAPAPPPAVQPAAPKPAPAAKPAEAPAASKSGFANGVPINPLD